jgi:excisionase family DNA binding protein
MDDETEFKIDGLELRDADWAAQSLGIERNTVYKFLNDGTLPGFKLGKKWFVDATDVATFVRQERVRQTNVRRIEHWVDEQLSRRAQRPRAPRTGVTALQELAEGNTGREWLVADVTALLRQEGYALDVAELDIDRAVREASLWVGGCVHCEWRPVLYSKHEDKSETAELCRECRDAYLRAVYENFDLDPERDPFVRRGIA